MATSDSKLEKENYDRLLAVFHIGSDVKRYLLDYYLSQNHLDLLDWLTNISKNFLQFEDIKRARKRSSKIKPSDLGINTVNTVLKYNCFDLFWDCCLLNTSLEDILNNHKDELYRIYRNSNRNYAGPSMSTQYSSQCLTKDQWDVLFKTEEHMVVDPEGSEKNISASPGLTVSSLDSNLNVLILNIVCPLYKTVNSLSECQIRISRTAVLEYEIETPVFEDILNKIETHILFIGIHCQFWDHFHRKFTAVKQTTFNRTLAQENRKIILEEGFNNPDLLNVSFIIKQLLSLEFQFGVCAITMLYFLQNYKLNRYFCAKSFYRFISTLTRCWQVIL